VQCLTTFRITFLQSIALPQSRPFLLTSALTRNFHLGLIGPRSRLQFTYGQKYILCLILPSKVKAKRKPRTKTQMSLGGNLWRSGLSISPILFLFPKRFVHSHFFKAPNTELFRCSTKNDLLAFRLTRSYSPYQRLKDCITFPHRKEHAHDPHPLLPDIFRIQRRTVGRMPCVRALCLERESSHDIHGQLPGRQQL
jgi:hypothetical protein